MYQALHATSTTLAHYLSTQIVADLFLSGPGHPFTDRSMDVYLSTPFEMLDAGDEGISLWLYRIARDEERLNDPPVRISPTQVRAAPLPLRLHYLVTPITTGE